MPVTDKDRIYFSSAIDKLYSMYETASQFVQYNSMNDIPTDKLMDFAITGFKEWALSQNGVAWLSGLGFSLTDVYQSESVYVNCLVCSGNSLLSDINVCENCGISMCSKCSFIVDDHYDLRWCGTCISGVLLSQVHNHR